MDRTRNSPYLVQLKPSIFHDYSLLLLPEMSESERIYIFDDSVLDPRV